MNKITESYTGQKMVKSKNAYFGDSVPYNLLMNQKKKYGLDGGIVISSSVESSSSFGNNPSISDLNLLNTENASGSTFEAYDSPLWNVLCWNIDINKSITGTIQMSLNSEFFFGVTTESGITEGVALVGETSFNNWNKSGQALNQLIKNNVLNLQNGENVFNSLFMRLTPLSGQYVLTIGNSSKYQYNLLLSTLPTKFVIASKRRMTFVKTPLTLTNFSSTGAENYLLDGREVPCSFFSDQNFNSYTTKIAKTISFTVGSFDNLRIGTTSDSPIAGWNRSFVTPVTRSSHDSNNVISGGSTRSVSNDPNITSIFMRAQHVYGTNGDTINLQVGKNDGDYRNSFSMDGTQQGGNVKVVLFTYSLVKFSLINYSTPYFSGLTNSTIQLQNILSSTKYFHMTNPMNSTYYVFPFVVPASGNNQPGTFYVEYEHDGILAIGVTADQNNGFNTLGGVTSNILSVEGSTIFTTTGLETIAQPNSGGDTTLYGNVKQLLIQVRNVGGTKTVRVGRTFDNVISFPAAYTSHVSFYLRPTGGCTYFKIKSIERETSISSYYP